MLRFNSTSIIYVKLQAYFLVICFPKMHVTFPKNNCLILISCCQV